MAIGMLAFMNVVWGAQFPFTKPASDRSDVCSFRCGNGIYLE